VCKSGTLCGRPTTSSVAYDGKIESIAMAEGKIVSTGSGNYQYEYYLQDHLYTNRVTFRVDTNGALKLTQVQNYYPFGRDLGDSTMNYSSSPQNLYKYEGKEQQPELNLNTYDFGARYYDPVLGRWTAIDPLAEESEDLSPYNYVENNPMNLMDPDGMQPNNGCYNWGGESWGSGWDWGGAGLSAGASLYNAWSAFSPKVTTTDFSGLGKLPGNFMQTVKPTSQGTISAWQPGVFDKWKSSGFLGKFTYDIVDEPFVAVRSIFWPFGEVKHLNGEYASAKEKQGAFANTAASFIPFSKGGFFAKAALEEGAAKGIVKIAEKNIFSRTGSGVYDLGTSAGRYVGQSKNLLARFVSHFSSGGKLAETELMDDIFHAMPRSTQLQREVYEQYLVEKYGLNTLVNKVNPMGGRMDLYRSMIENVIKTFNLPR
jgi:RHS repeat-associated protein